MNPLGIISRVACLVLGTLFSAVAVAAFITGTRAYPLERDTTQWSKTWGTLEYARVEGSSASIAVRYNFHVNGVRYVGNRLAVVSYGGKEFVLEARAERLEREQSLNGQTAVYYDPNDPSSSSLEVGVSGSIGCFVGAAIASLMSVACIHQAFWPKRVARAWLNHRRG